MEEERAEHQRRIIGAIGLTIRPKPFDRVDAVRGVDLDRGLVLLRRERLACYARPELLGEVVVAGTEAHVKGQSYQPLFGKPFVLVEAIEFGELDEE